MAAERRIVVFEGFIHLYIDDREVIEETEYIGLRIESVSAKFAVHIPRVDFAQLALREGVPVVVDGLYGKARTLFYCEVSDFDVSRVEVTNSSKGNFTRIMVTSPKLKSPVIGIFPYHTLTREGGWRFGRTSSRPSDVK